MKFLCYTVILIVFISGCSKDFPNEPKPNQSPHTSLWLFPESTLAEGHSKQHIHWLGDDPDGFIKGYLFTSGKIPSRTGTALDTIPWRWRIDNDSLIAFPLLVKRDTFQISVRAVDNAFQPVLPDSFKGNLPDQALIRFVPRGINPAGYAGTPFWDRNENGVFDAGDFPLNSLRSGMDPVGAFLGFPVLNQPPTVHFALDPGNPNVAIPDTTFTAASFAWTGTDPDGDQTITSYELALNDTSNAANIFSVDASSSFVSDLNVNLISLVVPRSRTDGITGVQTDSADVWSGTFHVNRKRLGTIPNMKIDSLNVFYVRARDIAGDASRFIRLPVDSTKQWFVKRPRGRLLIVDDYMRGDFTSALSFYKNAFTQVGFPDYDVLDITRGLSSVQDKLDGKVGNLVLPFTDPALIYTLQLFDVVFWYTEHFPSLTVAQYPLYAYTRDAARRGKVIFSTMFATADDPRHALRVFAPLDSVSSVIIPSVFVPSIGDNQIKGGAVVVPDASDPSDVYPLLRFNQLPVIAPAVFMRPVYKRADAEYIYHVRPEDSRGRLAYLATFIDLYSVSAVDAQNAWACGQNGIILHTSDAGISWAFQSSGTLDTLSTVHFSDANTGWIAGDAGTILVTSDGGSTWKGQPLGIPENLLGAYFAPGGFAVVVGTQGLLARRINATAQWAESRLHTSVSIRSVHFADPNVGIAVGDNGYIIRTTDAGANWSVISSGTTRRLNAVRFIDASNVVVVGGVPATSINPGSSTILRSTNSGSSWSVVSGTISAELRSVTFSNSSSGWVCGANGTIYQTLDAGSSWTPEVSSITPQSGGLAQTMNGIGFASANDGWSVGTGGMILHSNNGGTNWTTQPKGNLNVGVVDGVGGDGKRSFVFIGLPLHLMDGQGYGSSLVLPFLQHVLHDEFGK